MTRETKVGLLVGMGMILLIAIIVSDHLSVASQQDPANFMGSADRVQQSLGPVVGGEGFDPRRNTAPTRHEVLPLPQDLTAPPQRLYQPQEPAPRAPEPIEPAPQHDPFPRRAWSVHEQQASVDEPAVPPLNVRRDASADRLADDAVRIRPVADDASRAPQPLPEPPPPAADFYEVKAGDSLYAIAKKFYGDGEYWRMIVEANPGKVGSDGSVLQGVRLTLPNKRGLAGHPDFVPVLNERDRVASRGDGRLNLGARTAAANTVTVEPGQTLSEISSKHLGTSRRWNEILELNKDVLSRPEQLRAGMVLRLPTRDGQTGQGATTRTTTAAGGDTAASRRPAATSTYTVRSGDSLSSIAQQFLGDRNAWRKIYDANRDVLSNPNNVEVGTTLTIPQG